MTYDSKEDTVNHIERVRYLLDEVMWNLKTRGYGHDISKLREPEKSAFDRCTPLLQQVEFGTPEYNDAKAQLGEALQHHYACNSHHPQHFENGIEGMSLLDIVEMLADWKAASERSKNGSLENSIAHNNVYHLDSINLRQIFENTRKELDW